MSLRIRSWESIRRRILDRDGHVCMVPVHHRRCDGRATTVDHIRPRAHGGGHSDWNLRAANIHCNSSMGGKVNKKIDLMPVQGSRW